MTFESMLADVLAHQYAAKGVPSEEFEDDDLDVEAMMGGAGWEDLINE